MKLYIKEKVLDIRTRFFIKNENNENVYEVTNKIFSLGKKSTISDMTGNKIAYIEQEIFKLLPKYNIYFYDTFYCDMTKEFSLMKNNYNLSNGYTVKGDMLMHNITIQDPSGNVICYINREFFTIGDKYEIEIFDSNQLNIILAISTVIANEVNRKQDRND